MKAECIKKILSKSVFLCYDVVVQKGSGLGTTANHQKITKDNVCLEKFSKCAKIILKITAEIGVGGIMLVERPQVRVTEIGEYIRHHSCERRFKLEFNNREASREVPFAIRFFNPIDPVLQEAGRMREDEWERTLQDAELSDLTQYNERLAADDRSTSWDAFVDRVQNLSPGQSAYGREIHIEADLGAFRVAGQIDFALILWEEGQPKLRIVECKASRRDRTYHRIQVTLYRMIVRRLIQETQVTIGNTILASENIECAVARIDESTNEIQAILELEPLGNLEREENDIIRLLSDNGPLIRIIQSDLADLDYQLNMKCDGCVFNVHCFPESGIGHRLELLSIEPSLIRVLRNAGICTIDDLANLDLTGAQASQIREDPTFTASLDVLCQKARARRRTLPGGDADPDSYEVEAFPRRVQGQLPEHEMNGHHLIRVYLSVDYDYVENRLVALSAHVTKSSNQIHTGFIQTEDGRWQPNPEVEEIIQEIGRDENNRPIYEKGSLNGQTVICPISSLWSGRYDEDTGAERNLIQDFFHRLVDAIAEVSEVEEVPIHFYVWSRTEITRLVEACSRVDSRLLSHLRELLGCRESLDQLIYSCLQNEVNQRYALGWTGKGLVVVTSLRWFGRTYHWRRLVAGSKVDLDNVFTQDIFDFKTDLDLRADGSWAHNESECVTRHKFEIRSRFFDSLTVPYWRAYWREGLPDPDEPGIDPRVREAIRRYQASARPRYLSAYLEARVHALRWIEERIRFKNQDIVKPLMNISELPDFNLGVENTAQAAIDFLRLDQHVKVTDWIVNHLVPPADRVPLGRTIPVRDVVLQSSNVVTAMIDVEGYDIDLDSLNVRSDITEGSFVRLNPCFDNSHRGQTFRQLIRGGMKCIVNSINWDTGQITLDVIFNPHSTRYTLQSQTGALPFARATIDENVSDFVAGRVEERLSSNQGTHVYEWFDPENPQIPEQSVISEQDQNLYRRLLNRIRLPSGYGLAPDQVNAALDGLNAQIQLLQGPPGTGKTMTTAVALLLRILARCRKGDIILVAANTHTALDNLLQRIAEIMDNFQANARILGLSMPPISLTKVHSSQIDTISEGRILNFSSNRCISVVNQERRNAVLVVGGTTGALLKMADKLLSSRPFTRDYPNGLQTPMLIIDEASMIVFPHFLSLATFLTPNGEIMLAGDHRQLAPIVAHDWEREDRPPVILYQPFVSAYQAIQNIAQNYPAISERAIIRSALAFTFRLPPVILELIARLYRMDNIDLEGLPRESEAILEEEGGSWEQVWQGETGLYLVLHDERHSRRNNEIEAQIIEQVIEASGELESGSIAIVTPYRAQRTLLQTRLVDYQVDMIDTVERLQGGERPTVIVSATVSDPSAISTNVDFILNLNRSNVAFSRAQDRLIVVCSEELMNHIPAEVDQYDSAMLWKSMRNLCSLLIATIEIDGHTVRIFTFRPPVNESA